MGESVQNVWYLLEQLNYEVVSNRTIYFNSRTICLPRHVSGNLCISDSSNHTLLIKSSRQHKN